MIKTWIVSSLGWGNYSREYSTWILNGTLKFLWSHCGIVLYAPMYIRCFFQVKLRVEMSSSPLYTYDPAIPNHFKFCNKHEIFEKAMGIWKKMSLFLVPGTLLPWFGNLHFSRMIHTSHKKVCKLSDSGKESGNIFF